MAESRRPPVVELSFNNPGVKNQMFSSEAESEREKRKLEQLLRHLSPAEGSAGDEAAGKHHGGGSSSGSSSSKAHATAKSEDKKPAEADASADAADDAPANDAAGSDGESEAASAKAAAKTPPAPKASKPKAAKTAKKPQDAAAVDLPPDVIVAQPGINKRNVAGESKLHKAAMNGKVEAVLDLISKGADVNLADNSGWTPLHYAADPAVSETLLKAGANVDAVHETGNTALHEASKHDNVDVLRILLKYHSNPGLQNKDGLTPLELAASDTVREILRGWQFDASAERIKPKRVIDASELPAAPVQSSKKKKAASGSSGSGLADVLGPLLVSRASDRLPISMLASRSVERVFVFAGASWATRAAEFGQELQSWYGRLRMSPVAGSKVEVVYLSQDRSEGEFAAAFKQMPWLAVPYASRARAMSALGIDALPALLVLDMSGNVLSRSGRLIVEQDPDARHYPWDSAAFQPSQRTAAVQTAQSVLSTARWLLTFVAMQILGLTWAVVSRVGAFAGAKVKHGLHSSGDSLKRGARSAADHCIARFKALLWFLLTLPFRILLALLTYAWQLACGRRAPTSAASAPAAFPPSNETQIV
eukprot:m.78339 g.78339  ORF g.78339 m.78339 type:complete len:593 (+) comp14742_c0_seq2:161-1939(+)